MQTFARPDAGNQTCQTYPRRPRHAATQSAKVPFDGVDDLAATVAEGRSPESVPLRVRIRSVL